MKLVILAGGEAQRMGQDKAELSLGKLRLIDHVYAQIKIQCNEVIISGRHDYGLHLKVIPDAPSGPRGPVAALYSVWKTLLVSDEGFFTVPVDGPNIPSDLCERLYGKCSAVAEAPDGLHQAYAWWRRDALESVFESLNLSQSISLLKMATLCKAHHVYWADEAMFYNINTPRDLSAYFTQKAGQ